MTIRVGRVPTVARMRSMIGSSMPASRHDPEEQDREHEHADDGGEALDARQDQLACVEAEPADQSRGNRNDDQRD